MQKLIDEVEPYQRKPTRTNAGEKEENFYRKSQGFISEKKIRSRRKSKSLKTVPSPLKKKALEELEEDGALYIPRSNRDSVGNPGSSAQNQDVLEPEIGAQDRDSVDPGAVIHHQNSAVRSNLKVPVFDYYVPPLKAFLLKPSETKNRRNISMRS